MAKSDDMVELIEFIAKGLVDEPGVIEVNPVDGGKTLELKTSEDDRGRVIGRQGRVAKAMRSLLARAGGSELRLDIID
jgi:predicted RNA-binding protein YlqC (UPF0109 family)